MTLFKHVIHAMLLQAGAQHMQPESPLGDPSFPLEAELPAGNQA